MLTELTNVEYMVVKCHSLIRKLYPFTDAFEATVSNREDFFRIRNKPSILEALNVNLNIFFPKTTGN